jgi:hypothetical protein
MNDMATPTPCTGTLILYRVPRTSGGWAALIECTDCGQVDVVAYGESLRGAIADGRHDDALVVTA